VIIALVAIALCVNAVEDQGGVSELAQEKEDPDVPYVPVDTDTSSLKYHGTGGGDTHPMAYKGGEGPGYYKRIANFPGPPHGLPGYKESHDWVEAFDIFSPLVFDYRWYRVMMKGQTIDMMKTLTEEDLKTDFLQKVKAGKAGSCPQGSIWFDANAFFKIYLPKVTEFSMSDNNCELIFKYYLKNFIYGDYKESAIPTGATVAVHETGSGNSRFPTIATKIFKPEGSVAASDDTELTIVVNQANYVPTVGPGGYRQDNMFAPARHMTLAFWMALGAQNEAPNAEMLAYGARKEDNYFRTGFGCLETDFSAETNNCYFIFVFFALQTEYFHTYDANNFAGLRTAVAGNKWFHVVMILTTIHPGHPADMAAGQTDDSVCPNNKNVQGPCSALLELYVEKIALNIVDWAHGTDTTRPGGTNDVATPGWGNVGNVWANAVLKKDTAAEVVRRWWMAPPVSCTEDGQSAVMCGGIEKNSQTYDFPWYGPYREGLFLCDFHTIPSGNGMFGTAPRRALALDALYETMAETVNVGCFVASISDAATNGNGGTQQSVAGGGAVRL